MQYVTYYFPSLIAFSNDLFVSKITMFEQQMQIFSVFIQMKCVCDIQQEA